MFFRDLETPRLRLRGIAPADRAFVFRQFSDARVTRFLKDEEPYERPEQADELIAFYTAPEPRAQHRWMLTLKDSNAVIGTCGFHNWNARVAYAEMGYDLWPDFTSAGYMTEAARAALDFAWRDMALERVTLHIHPQNAPSKRLAERLGFVLAPERANYIFRGETIAHEVYMQKRKPVS